MTNANQRSVEFERLLAIVQLEERIAPSASTMSVINHVVHEALQGGNHLGTHDPSSNSSSASSAGAGNQTISSSGNGHTTVIQISDNNQIIGSADGTVVSVAASTSGDVVGSGTSNSSSASSAGVGNQTESASGNGQHVLIQISTDNTFVFDPTALEGGSTLISVADSTSGDVTTGAHTNSASDGSAGFINLTESISHNGMTYEIQVIANADVTLNSDGTIISVADSASGDVTNGGTSNSSSASSAGVGNETLSVSGNGKIVEIQILYNDHFTIV